MTYNSNDEDFALTLPITQNARKIAQQFASQQPTSQKAEQVWLNTLAVCVMNDYLQMMGFPTNVSASLCWNRVTRMCADVADLEVTGIGRLECRPIRAFEQTYQIPPEVREERIGYVVVQIDESFREATVLGFTQTAAIDALPISQLQPIEDLIDRLSLLMQPTVVSTVASNRTTVNLSRWLEDVFDAGWQTIESLLNPAQSSLAFSFRNEINTSAIEETDDNPLVASVRRAKLIDLNRQLGVQPVVLVVELIPESDYKTNILLQLHPSGNQTYLPPLLQLMVLDELGATFMEAQARSADNYMQLEFSGNLGERFSIKVAMGDDSITEDFRI